MKALITGTGIAGLATALRLARRGYDIEMVERFSRPGGRLNVLEKDGFRFDMGPSFFSMSYEFEELARDAAIELPFKTRELDPIYTVWYDTPGKNFTIYRDFERLASEFEGYEPGFREKMERFMKSAGKLYHDTEQLIIKRNFDSLFSYLASMAQVPPGHLPKLGRNFWQELGKYFSSQEVKEILSLVSFFLGGTPFDTPAVYTMLSYTEFVHDGYYNVEGGMYRITEGFVDLLKKKGVKISYNSDITGYEDDNRTITALTDSNGNRYEADLFVINADAALFRSKVLQRERWSAARLDKLNWTMAPFTIYLGLDTKVPGIEHHNYFLRNNFTDYATGLYKNRVDLEQPYYYVNVVSRYNDNAAPEGGEALYILVPVPDLRRKSDWTDRDRIAGSIIDDLSKRIGFDLSAHIVSKTILTPQEWEGMFDLYRGSGLGLGHNLGQMGWLRPSNQDEQYSNLFYTGSSTVPGTGIPMAVISSDLVTRRIDKKYGTL